MRALHYGMALKMQTVKERISNEVTLETTGHPRLWLAFSYDECNEGKDKTCGWLLHVVICQLVSQGPWQYCGGNWHQFIQGAGVFQDKVFHGHTWGGRTVEATQNWEHLVEVCALGRSVFHLQRERTYKLMLVTCIVEAWTLQEN